MRTDLDSQIDNDDRRWEDIEAGLGALASVECEWDADLEEWVRSQRAQDPRRFG